MTTFAIGPDPPLYKISAPGMIGASRQPEPGQGGPAAGTLSFAGEDELHAINPSNTAILMGAACHGSRADMIRPRGRDDLDRPRARCGWLARHGRRGAGRGDRASARRGPVALARGPGGVHGDVAVAQLRADRAGAVHARAGREEGPARVGARLGDVLDVFERRDVERP